MNSSGNMRTVLRMQHICNVLPTNPLSTGFSGYQNVNKEIIQPNIEKELYSPETLCFRGFLYVPQIYETP